MVTKRWLILILVLGLFPCLAIARATAAPQQDAKKHKRRSLDVEYREVKKIPISSTLDMRQECYAIAYEAYIKQEPFELTEWPAKLSFSCNHRKVRKGCFAATPTVGKAPYKCQFVKELSIIPIFEKKNPKEGLLFVALFTGGGSGTFSQITLWVFDRVTDKFVNILPQITITNQGEYQILRNQGDKLDGTLVVADYLWGKGESHFSPHKFQITIYQYNQSRKLFERVGEYVSKRICESLDNADRIDVISHEIDNVRKSIQK